MAEAFDRGEDLVGGFGPAVGFGVFVVRLDEGVDVGFQLGGGTMGGALGPLLARSSLPVKEWRSDSDEKQDKLLLAEGVLIGCMVIGIYVLVLLEVIPALADWVLPFFA